MVHTETHATDSASKHRLLEAASNGMAPVLAGFRTWRRAVAARRALADLTPDQLKDIGCLEPTAPKAIVRVGVGLMTDLMSMR